MKYYVSLIQKNNNKFQEKNIIRLSNNDRHFKIQKHKIFKFETKFIKFIECHEYYYFLLVLNNIFYKQHIFRHNNPQFAYIPPSIPTFSTSPSVYL